MPRAQELIIPSHTFPVGICYSKSVVVLSWGSCAFIVWCRGISLGASIKYGEPDKRKCTIS